LRPTPARTLILPAVALVLAPVAAIARGSSVEGDVTRAVPAAIPFIAYTAAAADTGSARADDHGIAPLGIAIAADHPVRGHLRGAAAAGNARSRLARYVVRSSHDDALQLALEAYYNYRSANPQLVRKPYLYFVDLGLDNRTPRGWVFDMDALELVDGPFHVAHGVGSSRQRDGVPTVFSNRPGSKASSLGLYLAEETYRFSGRAGGGSYSSIGLRMRGESGSFNDAARRRGVVAHGAPYVTRGDAGRSEGCPAMEQHRAQRLLPMLADGGVVFIFSPRDPLWLRSDPWIHAE
jgi:hypothetical protein